MAKAKVQRRLTIILAAEFVSYSRLMVADKVRTPAFFGVLKRLDVKVALLTDGRGGASGNVPAAIHASPEALDGGPIAKLRDGDRVPIGAAAEELKALVDETEWAARAAATPYLSVNEHGLGCELFQLFRAAIGAGETGAAVIV